MKAILKVKYVEKHTPYGPVKRQYWFCSKCGQEYHIKYQKQCKKCKAELEREPVKTWLE